MFFLNETCENHINANFIASDLVTSTLKASYLLHDTEVASLLVQLGFAEVDHHVLIAGGDLERGHQKGEEKHQGGLALPHLLCKRTPVSSF